MQVVVPVGASKTPSPPCKLRIPHLGVHVQLWLKVNKSHVYVCLYTWFIRHASSEDVQIASEFFIPAPMAHASGRTIMHSQLQWMLIYSACSDDCPKEPLQK